MSVFITFEGGEGSGKSVQVKLLYRRLQKLAIPVLLLREPGGTELGKKLTRLLKWSQGTDILPLTELLLFNASRAQLVEEVIQPHLNEGKIIVCDRFAASSIVYQGYGRGLDVETVEMINNVATRGLKPDLTVLLDIAVEEGFRRKGGENRDRLEKEDIEFYHKVREGYLTLAKKKPERWLVIDAEQSKVRISEIIWQHVKKLLSE
jgi:dTMP kinase